ncbi:MAG: hypothetical protein WD942_00150 [Dehalococcoidia bacterium]
MSTGNPASRLLEIAREARSLKEGINARQAWALTFGTGEDFALLMTRMGEAMMLVKEALEELDRRFPDQHETHQHWVTKVSQAFLADGLGGSWKTIQEHFDRHTINYLTMASNLLDQPRDGESMRPEQVVSMRERLEAFLEEVGDSSMSEASKEIINHHVSQILEALDERGINSREAVEDAIHRTMGKAAMDSHIREDLQKSGMGKKLYEAAMFVYATIGAISDAGQLPDALRKLLGGG